MSGKNMSDKRSSSGRDHERESQGERSRSDNGGIHWYNQEDQGHNDSFSRASSSNHDANQMSGSSRRRHVKTKSRICLRMASLRTIGGVNSIDHFAQSWRRAANFPEIVPNRPSFRLAGDGEAAHGESRSLLRQAFQQGNCGPEQAIDDGLEYDGDEADERTPLRPAAWTSPHEAPVRTDGKLIVPPSLSSGFGGTYGTQYSSQSFKRPQATMVHSGQSLLGAQAERVDEAEAQHQALLIKQVDEDGVALNIVVGQSTLPQTTFNSINVLVGVGSLSLPLGLLYSGWVVGIVFFFFAAISTQYTAKLLAKCLDVDNSLITFSDLAYVCFGRRLQLVASFLFSAEILGACVAMVVLFADSLNVLIPGLDVTTCKLICAVILIPLIFLPLRLLSFTSVLGILCTSSIVLIIFIDGLIKPDQPGSLRSPATTRLFPKHWTTIPLSLGLLMSPWGGHSVFPNIYRDMRHPYKYHRAIDITYIFTFMVDISLAVIGILMFGDAVENEVTSNILLLGNAYPRQLSLIIITSIAILPLTKISLNARPIVSTIEVLVGISGSRDASHGQEVRSGPSALNSRYGALIGNIVIRLCVIVVIVSIAIVFPSFDRIMTLLGSVCCFSICIIFPVGFHLKMFGEELSRAETVTSWFLLAISAMMACVSTVFALLPQSSLTG